MNYYLHNAVFGLLFLVAFLALIYVWIMGMTIFNGFDEDGDKEGFVIGLAILVPLTLILAKYYRHLNKMKARREETTLEKRIRRVSEKERKIIIGLMITFNSVI